MATRTFAVDRDARVGTNGSLNLGAGACDHLPVGEGGGYEYRSFIKFDNDWSGMTDVSEVRLYLTNDDDSSTTDHLTRGGAGARSFYVDYVNESWTAGTASHPMTDSNGSISSGGDMVYPGPTCLTGNPAGTGDYRVGPFGSSDTNNDQQSWDITNLAAVWIPTTVYVSGGSTPGYGLGLPNYGVRLIREDLADSVEFWSSEKGGSTRVPKIVVTYTNNNLPTIEITSPTDGSVVTGGTTYATPSVTIGATATDADGNAITNVQFEFDTTADFASPYLTSTADDDTAGVVSRAVSSALHPRGTEIFVRARASDATGYGSWSTTVSFTINNATAPVITGTAGTISEMTVEGTDTGPRAVVRFTYSDPEGQSISRYTAGLYSDSGGTTLLGTLHDVTTTTAPTYIKSDYTGLVHGTTYYWFVQTWDADGLSTGRVSQARVAKWATRDEYYAVSSPSAWTTSTVKVESTDTRAVVQHGVQTTALPANAGVDPGTFNTDLSSVSPSGATAYWARYWLFAWNGAATSGVQITSHTLTYTSSTLTADGWTLHSDASITSSRSWYGTRCLKIMADISDGWAGVVPVTGFKVGQEYTISGRIYSNGDSGAYIGIWDGSSYICSTTPKTASTADFEYVYATFTAQSESYEFYCQTDGAGGDAYALFDALKIEQGPIATPWTPSVLSRAVVVDGNGVQVDGRGGGVFRVRGSSTATSENEVDTTDLGLRFASPLTIKEISAPASPPANYRRLYVKADGLLYMKNSGGTESLVGSNDHSTLSNLTTGDPHTQYILETLVDAKGDLLVGSAADTAARLAVGTDTYHLVADSVAANGIKWDRPYFFVSVWWTETSLSAALNSTKNLDLAYPSMPNYWTPSGLPAAGSVIYQTVRISSPRVTGTSTFRLYCNDIAAEFGPTMQLDGTDTNSDAAGPYAIGTYTISSGHAITMRQKVTSGTWDPTAVNVAALTVFAIPII